MPDSSPTHESSPGPASPSAPPADAVPAPAAADEAAPLLVSSTETPRDEALQAPTRSRLVYVLTLLSVAFSIDTLVVVLVTQFIRPYWHYLPWGFYDKQTGLGGVTALALIVSSINLSRLRGNRPLIPLFFNMIFDLAICFYAIALATPGLADMIDYRDCTYADDEDECLRGALPVRIVAGVMLGTALVVGTEIGRVKITAYWPIEVIVTHKERNHELTAAFARPELIAHVQDFAVHCTNLLEGNQLQGVTEMKKALLVTWELDRGSVVVLLATAALLSAGVGLIVGLLSRRADIAIACAASCFTVIQIIETSIPWYFK
ncbi:hypothetical protein MMC30_001273 [Trapelia coarctata]|nr:hypothetical protein [Trapelia coarctata]